MSNDNRPRLDDILGRSGAASNDFGKLWEQTEAAGDLSPLPAGRYRCLIVSGELTESKTNRTPSYRIGFQVLDPAPFAGRRLWADLWLTPRALPTSKRDLAKLRIHDPAQLRQAPPSGMVADVRVALRTEDDGTAYNRVQRFDIVEGEAVADLSPDADPDDEEDPVDSDGFDWSTGQQRGTPNR